MGREKMAEERIPVSEILQWEAKTHGEVSNTRQRRSNPGKRHRSKDKTGTAGMVEAAFEKSEGTGGIEDRSGVVVGRESGATGRDDSSDRERLQVAATGLPRLRFRATLASSRDYLNVNNDNEARLVFEIPASELPEVIKLVMFRNKVFWVEVSS